LRLPPRPSTSAGSRAAATHPQAHRHPVGQDAHQAPAVLSQQILAGGGQGGGRHAKGAGNAGGGGAPAAHQGLQISSIQAPGDAAILCEQAGGQSSRWAEGRPASAPSAWTAKVTQCIAASARVCPPGAVAAACRCCDGCIARKPASSLTITDLHNAQAGLLGPLQPGPSRAAAGAASALCAARTPLLLTGPGVGTPSSGLPPRSSSCLLRPTVDSEAPILLEPPTHLEARQRQGDQAQDDRSKREWGLDMLREERKPGGKHARRGAAARRRSKAALPGCDRPVNTGCICIACVAAYGSSTA
jgi:hypothetical protein